MSIGSASSGAHSGNRPDEHLGDLVADLADGRLADADPGLVLQHLDSCPACRTELADAVVAAAALRGVVANPAPEPPEHVGGRPAAEAALEPVALEPAAPEPADEHVGERRRRPALAGALAVALLAVGALGGVGWTHRPGRDATPVAAAAAPLTALLRTGGQTSGAAVITGSGTTRRMTITADVRTPADGSLVTVWLTASGEPTQRIGTLEVSGHGSDSSDHGSFTMSATTAGEYSAVVLTEQPGSATSLDRSAVVATAQLA